MSDNSSTTQPININEVQNYYRCIVRDIYEWRRKDLSIVVLLVATATWVVLEVYQFNFIPVASWLAVSALSAAFIWGNILRLFGKEAPTPSMSGVERAEETVMEMANSIREWCEEGVRWMFRVGAEKEWFVFARTVASLWLLSVVGTFTDLITFLYIGTVLGMTVPVLYAKYEYKIRECWERLREQGKRFCIVIDDKGLRKIKDRMVGHDQQIKQHKME